MSDKINGLVHISSEVKVGRNYEDDYVVELGFHYSNANRSDRTSVVVDRATASRLIRQLQKSLDDSYNDMINQRPESPNQDYWRHNDA